MDAKKIPHCGNNNKASNGGSRAARGLDSCEDWFLKVRKIDDFEHPGVESPAGWLINAVDLIEPSSDVGNKSFYALFLYFALGVR